MYVTSIVDATSEIIKHLALRSVCCHHIFITETSYEEHFEIRTLELLYGLS